MSDNWAATLTEWWRWHYSIWPSILH